MENGMMAQLVAQVTYYFSDENVSRDTYMWVLMDQEHYIPIAEIASWPRALRACPYAEVEGSRVRPRFIPPHLPLPQHMFQPRELIDHNNNIIFFAPKDMFWLSKYIVI